MTINYNKTDNNTVIFIKRRILKNKAPKKEIEKKIQIYLIQIMQILKQRGNNSRDENIPIDNLSSRKHNLEDNELNEEEKLIHHEPKQVKKYNVPGYLKEKYIYHNINVGDTNDKMDNENESELKAYDEMPDIVEEEVIENNNNIFKKDIYCLTLLDTIINYEKEVLYLKFKFILNLLFSAKQLVA